MSGDTSSSVSLPATGNPFVDLGLRVGLPLAIDLIKWLKSKGTPEADLTAHQIADIVSSVHATDALIQADVQAALRGE